MNIILVSYDLHRPGKDYEKLWEHLKSYAWAKPLESLWLVKTTYSAEQIRDDVINYIDQNDSVFVADITRMTTAWKNIPDEVARWIKMKP
ncbi:MAG: CRISPR-associated protein Cas2 [Pseudomonadota bacterium]